VRIVEEDVVAHTDGAWWGAGWGMIANAIYLYSAMDVPRSFSTNSESDVMT
jgi:hypothetical protein